MWSFEGDFRSKPTQSLRGASKQEHRTSLLKRAHEERQKREQVRLRNSCAIKIQSTYLGYRERKKQLTLMQQEFDVELKEATKNPFNPSLLSKLLRKLSFFFRAQSDGQRLVLVSQLLLKHKDEYLNWVFRDPNHAIFQIKKLLQVHLRYLMSIVDSLTPIAVPMRMLEMFISPTMYDPVTQHCGSTSDSIVCHILKHLIKHGYFECMRDILNGKVPSSLEKSPTPPTPVAASVLDLIMSPISFATATADKAFSRQVMLAVCRTLLCPSFSEQVAQFLLPAMAYGKYPFPFVELIQTLINQMSDTSISTMKPNAVLFKGPTVSSSSMSSASSKSIVSPNNSLLLTPCMLYAVLVIGESKIGQVDSVLGNSYLELLRQLLPYLPGPEREMGADSDSDSDEAEQMVIEEGSSYQNVKEMREKCIQVLDSSGHIKCILTTMKESSDVETVERIAGICHTLLFRQRLDIHRLRLLYTLAFNTSFMRNLWQACTTISMQTVTGSSNPLLNMLSSGLPMADKDLQKIAPLLSTFCSMFSYSLLTLHDADFYGDNKDGVSSMPFTLREMVPMSLALRNACLGIIELAHPDAKVSFNEDYSQALHKTGIGHRKTTEQEDLREMCFWDFLFKVLSTLVRQIYSRDSRRPFCVEGHWLSSRISVWPKRHTAHNFDSFVFTRRPFSDHTPLESQDEKRPPVSNREVRSMIILTELPFVVSFEERVTTLQGLIRADKENYQGQLQNFNMGPSINIIARRPYIYEDAFDNLSPGNAPNLKMRMRVQLKNAAGLDEVGIDGGGIFREFLTELLKAGFDPNRGFFKYTSDRQLYPNAQASILEPNFRQHFYFLGRMLGKALLENMLVELPFASFFLAKILSQHSANLDIHHLQSMDPIVYKNLLFVKNYEGDVSDLGLDFTVVSDEFGETKVYELKRGGRHTAVTKENRIEYIHLMADYLLNRQTRHHCASFREGVADVIKLDWLQMFSSQELQVLISGAAIPIDIADLKRHTNYSGGYTDSHPVIMLFWEVVAQFTDKQKRQLLKFVTSCSRAPLLGFKDLHPVFCVHYAGQEEDRLPTASTCMNLLKLPEFKDASKLREKLLYAIESGAGFELS